MYGELTDLVPKRFASASPSSTHRFAILSPRFHEAQRNQHAAAYCRFRHGKHVTPLLILLNKEPTIGNAVLGLAALPKNGYRPAKYLDLYKILEGLGESPNPDHSVLRHALAHSPEALNRPATVQRLQCLFGSTSIDFNKTQHLHTFWRLFGELLVATDVALAKRITERMKFIQLANETR